MSNLYTTRKPVAALSDRELIAHFLTASNGRSAYHKASEMLETAGSIVAVVGGVSDECSQYLTDAQGRTIQAGIEVGRRIAYETVASGDVLSSPEHVRHYLSLHLTGLGHEVFSGLFLDNRHRVIEYRELFTGTIDSAAVYPREIVKRCLQCNAAAVIFAHNHPSGVAEPSDTDVRLTRKLVDALALIDVRVLDHLIIGKGVQTSLAERGLM